MKTEEGKHRRKNILENELDWLDPDQELTIEDDNQDYRIKPSTFRESLSRGFRSILAITLCIVVPALWYFDWNPSAIADETSSFVTGFFEEGETAVIAPPPPPEAVTGEGGIQSSLEMSMVDYAAALNERGLLEEFSSPAVSAFYQNGITIDYLVELREAGLVEDFSFPAVVAFFQNEVPLDYLNSLKAENLLDELSFPAVVAFHQNEVPIDYLNQMRDANLLEQTSFPAVVAYFTNEVTIEFLTELRERDLLDNLSFPDVVNMFQNN